MLLNDIECQVLRMLVKKRGLCNLSIGGEGVKPSCLPVLLASSWGAVAWLPPRLLPAAASKAVGGPPPPGPPPQAAFGQGCRSFLKNAHLPGVQASPAGQNLPPRAVISTDKVLYRRLGHSTPFR